MLTPTDTHHYLQSSWFPVCSLVQPSGGWCWWLVLTGANQARTGFLYYIHGTSWTSEGSHEVTQGGARNGGGHCYNHGWD